MLSSQMTKTFRDNCDKNIVQQTSCEPLSSDVEMQSKMYFLVPFVRPCMHHKYGGISESRACKDCVGPRPVISLDHQKGQRIFWDGPKIFELYAIFSNCTQHIFPRGAKIFLRGFSPPGCGPGGALILDAELYTTCPGERVLVVMTHQV